jgi:hypothetical protein
MRTRFNAMRSSAPPRTDSAERDKLLTRGELAVIVLSVLPIFFFFAGPIWEHPFRIDAAVYLSYAPIPILVALALLRRHVLSVAGLLVNTITALSIKYVITTSFAFVLWAFAEPPALARPPDSEGSASTRAATEALPSASAEVVFDGHAIVPSRAELERGEAIAFRSIDGSLHTLRAKRSDGSIAFNLPVIPGRTSRPQILTAGELELSCAVHPNEAHAHLTVTTARDRRLVP